MNDPTPTGRTLSAAFSLTLPGSGQFYQGYSPSGLLYISIAVACWAVAGALIHFTPALPTWLAVFGFAGHVLAAIDAGRKHRPSTPSEEQERHLP